ncbi:hypothetical protein [Ktedonobacter racemifer]|uniref:DUF4177 domain-containing protein n=1 Tax=Ktedonobacter racemifer DSM 44963 TaxID=485913 RepID=D6U6X6_KTERA|nr:hypothetical protein [Ktedonobacter racemifer]EFH80737.1 hypothetical protein Krac_1353 [Ktedonobacter racemifer DSM 44963]
MHMPRIGMGYLAGKMEKQESQPGSVFIPMVYEQAQAARWEYKILTVDPAEEALPDEVRLSELGAEGWVMAGLLDERSTGKGKKIHYYFLRQV